MADKLELAKAYIQVVPTTDGIKNSLTTAMDGEAGKAGKQAGDKAGSGLINGLKTAGTAAAAAAGAAISAGGAAFGKILKDSLADYADYEQLVGGVETLFSESADTVQKYAASAYKTAGLSANEYMETATGFAASLVSSLGGDTKQAAEYADTAIRSMSDNANKMGTDMESLQFAYQGFAKQNYTMLDNLNTMGALAA